MAPKRVKKVMTIPINVIFGHLQVIRFFRLFVSFAKARILTIFFFFLKPYRKRLVFAFGFMRIPRHSWRVKLLALTNT
jgi:hypothetical protein